MSGRPARPFKALFAGEPRAQLTVILAKNKGAPGRLPANPEFHAQPLSESALAAMPWAL
jgi:hypothetical protein